MDIVGIDPGPVTGIVRLRLDTRDLPAALLDADALQVTPGAVITVLDALLQQAPDGYTIALERFVVGNRSTRSATPEAGAITRDLVARIEGWALSRHLLWATRPAADVKPWATDTRLGAAGLLSATTGMRHARDAARHALYRAVSTYGLPDPLSRRGRAA